MGGYIAASPDGVLKLGRGPKMDATRRRRPTSHRFAVLCSLFLYLRNSRRHPKNESVIAFVLGVASVALVLVSVQQTVPYALAELGDAA